MNEEGLSFQKEKVRLIICHDLTMERIAEMWPVKTSKSRQQCHDVLKIRGESEKKKKKRKTPPNISCDWLCLYKFCSTEHAESLIKQTIHCIG